MKSNRIFSFLAIIIILVDLAYFYPKFTSEVAYEIKTTQITRAIDGDTIETDLGKIRLLGINTPEKKMPYYDEAKEFLRKYENESVQIEIHEKDKYGRILGYAYFNNEMINAKILEKGLGNLYVYEKDAHFPELEKAEKFAREKELGIWKKSKNYGCLKIIKFDYTEENRCSNQEQLILNNECGKLNLTLKDDANHISRLNLETGVFSENFSCVFNDEGDSLFIRDEEGLVLFQRH